MRYLYFKISLIYNILRIFIFIKFFPETATNYEFEGSYVFAETNLPVTTQAKIKQLGYTEGF